MTHLNQTDHQQYRSRRGSHHRQRMLAASVVLLFMLGACSYPTATETPSTRTSRVPSARPAVETAGTKVTDAELLSDLNPVAALDELNADLDTASEGAAFDTEDAAAVLEMPTTAEPREPADAQAPPNPTPQRTSSASSGNQTPAPDTTVAPPPTPTTTVAPPPTPTTTVAPPPPPPPTTQAPPPPPPPTTTQAPPPPPTTTQAPPPTTKPLPVPANGTVWAVGELKCNGEPSRYDWRVTYTDGTVRSGTHYFTHSTEVRWKIDPVLPGTASIVFRKFPDGCSESAVIFVGWD